MTNISLRTYNREIEEMINQGRIEEVIVHCRHILNFYPKHIETYRLLGKSFLDSQRFSDASDIFQRILSVVPDDFIANIGMSIIREDEGNLDAAIWHMERSFEVQPSNKAIQDELKRLYGKRDGIEPPKIRLTKGALSRMYAQGDLYQQAIGEIRSALSEDPQRYDLQVLLARMYYLNNQPVEAAETCSSILKNLPYCLDANRILADVLRKSERSDEADIYHQRVVNLDPYAAFIPPDSPIDMEPPDDTVVLTKFEWKPGQVQQETQRQPSWAASLGIELEESMEDEEEVPDWLAMGTEAAVPDDAATEIFQRGSLVGETPAMPEVFTEDIVDTPELDLPDPEDELELPSDEEASDVEDMIPDWMKDAGWAHGSGEAETPPSLQEEGDESTEEISKGEIPEWLREMAPADADEPPGAADTTEDDLSGEMSPWLETSPPGPTDSVIMWLEETKSEVEPMPPDPADEPEISQSEKTDEEIPEWLQSLAGQITATGMLATSQDEVEETPTAHEDQTPEFESTPSTPEALETPVSDMDVEPEIEVEPDAAVPEGVDLEDQDAALAWLEGLAEKQGADEAELLTSPEERVQDVPDWVQQSLEDETFQMGEIEPLSEETEPEEAIDALPAESIPDWLTELDHPEPIISEASELETAGEIPDWLTEAGVDAPDSETLVVDSASFEAAPDWLGEPEEIVSEPPAPDETDLPLPGWFKDLEQAAEIQAEEDVVSEDVETPTLTDQPDWMAETIITKREPEETTSPEWLKETLGPPIEETKAEQVTEEVPEWLLETAGPESPIVSETILEEPVSELVSAEIEEDLPETFPQASEAEYEPALETLDPEAEIPVTPVGPQVEETTIEVAPDVEEVEAEWMLETALPEMVPEDAVEEEISTEEPVTVEVDETVEISAADITTEVREEELPSIEVEPEPDWMLETAIPEATPETPVLETVGETPQIEQVLPPTPSIEEMLSRAQTALSEGQLQEAMSDYNRLIRRGKNIDLIIDDLRNASYQFPMDMQIMETLGDAFVKANKLQDALDTYTKTEELLR